MEMFVVVPLLLVCALASLHGATVPDVHMALLNVNTSLDAHKEIIEKLRQENKEQAAKLRELEEHNELLNMWRQDIQRLSVLTSTNASSCHDYPNVALGGRATQSDQVNGAYGAAGNAIDGNRESNYYAGSCSCTKEQRDPWWRVDLLERYIITAIIVTNRGDNYPERLDGFGVRVGDSLHNNGNDNRLVAVPEPILAGQSVTITFLEQVEGRFVNVQLPGENKVLTLCEVEVYGFRVPTRENLAVKGKASQISVYQNGYAYNAIDGNREPDWGKGSCTYTGRQTNPWWRLDLGKTHRIYAVNVTNILQNSARLNDAEIRVGDSLENDGNDNERFAVIDRIHPGFTMGFTHERDCAGKCAGQCGNWLDGRYVNIVVPGKTDYMHLCEVQVYGSVLD